MKEITMAGDWLEGINLMQVEADRDNIF